MWSLSADQSGVLWHRGELPTALSGAPCLKWRVINTCGTATDTGDSRAGHLFIEEPEGIHLTSIVCDCPAIPIWRSLAGFQVDGVKSRDMRQNAFRGVQGIHIGDS